MMFRIHLLSISIVCLLASVASAPLEGSNQQTCVKKYSKHAIPKKINLTKMESDLVQMINSVRVGQGLSPLQQRRDLVICARQHSDNMANRIVNFGHDGFSDRAEQMKKLIRLKAFGENVAYSYNVEDHLRTAVSGWMNSSGHRKNILGDYNSTGIGIAYDKRGVCYITQLFARVVQ